MKLTIAWLILRVLLAVFTCFEQMTVA
jgi:hypothetical protein